MQTYQTKGLILKVLPFRDTKQIVTAFSPDQGLIQMMVKRSRKSQASVTPFTEGEFMFMSGRSDLLRCQDFSVIYQHVHLRERLESIEAACEMGRAIQATQMAHKSAPLLYQLMISYLQKIPSFDAPEVLAASFRLKLLRHEGLFGGLSEQCVVCKVPTLRPHLFLGESYCVQHAPQEAISLSEDEAKLITLYTFGRSFEQLTEAPIVHELMDKIKKLSLQLF